MKKVKIIAVGLLLVIVGLAPVSAETWEQYLNRVNRMSEAVIAAMLNSGITTGYSDERIGVLWATHEWCRTSYLHIRNNYPGLSQQQKDYYTLNSRVHSVEVDKMEKIIYRFSRETFNAIAGSYNYWIKHLENGGTIRF